MAFPREFRLTVALRADGGFIGRACGKSECGRYFRVHKDDLRDEMHCPYCGDRFCKEDLTTAEQSAYFKEAVAREVLPAIEDELSRIIKRTFKGPMWKVTSSPRRSKPPLPEPPTERDTDSELACPSCSFRFRVDGIFGYCPGCRSENLLLYDANLAIIRAEIASASDPQRSLRHAYADLVSTFEIFCRKEAARRGVAPARFQNLESARAAFQAARGIDIMSPLSASSHLALRRAFQKRHTFEHNGGVVDDKYVKAVPEDAALLGTVAALSVGELEEAALAVRELLGILVADRSAPPVT